MGSCNRRIEKGYHTKMRSSFLSILAILCLFGTAATTNVFGNEGFRRASLESRQNQQVDRAPQEEIRESTEEERARTEDEEGEEETSEDSDDSSDVEDDTTPPEDLSEEEEDEASSMQALQVDEVFGTMV